MAIADSSGLTIPTWLLEKERKKAKHANPTWNRQRCVQEAVRRLSLYRQAAKWGMQSVVLPSGEVAASVQLNNGQSMKFSACISDATKHDTLPDSVDNVSDNSDSDDDLDNEDLPATTPAPARAGRKKHSDPEKRCWVRIYPKLRQTITKRVRIFLA